jgi:hypothetical protein
MTQVNDCCKQPHNLIAKKERQDLVIRVCSVCGRRHFELTVDPIKLGIKLAPM